MYDAGPTGLIMFTLAALMLLLLCEPGEPGISPSVLMLTSGGREQAPCGGESSLLCYPAAPGWVVWATAAASQGTVRHLSPLLNPQRNEKQVQSSTGLIHSRCHKISHDIHPISNI